jgi:transcription termination factor Rho
MMGGFPHQRNPPRQTALNLLPFFHAATFTQTPIAMMNLERLKLETTRENLLSRFIDLLAPIATGQRGLIVGPRHTGQRLILETIANSIAVNHPEVVVMVLLLDHHEEEVAAVGRALKGEVFSSTWQESEARHIHLAESVMAKARYLVEEKRDVLVLVDSLTRLAQAYNEVLPSLEKTGPSTLNPYALRQTRRCFEAMRKLDVGGSLTIVAIADVDSLIPAEEMLLEDLMSVAEVQILLEDKVLDQGIFPAVNIHRSRNINEEMCISPEGAGRIHVLRKVLEPLSPVEAAKLLGSKLLRTRSNREFLNNMSSI